MNEKYGFIYITTNHINGKKYIGQRIYSRTGWKTYLGSGIVLNRAIKKYGKENFSKEIIEECDSKEHLDEREIYWISYYNAIKSRNFYNIASGGDGGNTTSGFDAKRLAQLKKLRSKRLIERHQNGKETFNTKLTKDIVVNIIIPRLKNNEFNSDIAKDFNVSSGTIDDIRHHRTWKKYTEGIIFDNISSRKRGRTPKQVIQYSLDGRKIRHFNSAYEAGNAVGSNPKTIMDVCSGNKKQCYGYIWRYNDDSSNKYEIDSLACS